MLFELRTRILATKQGTLSIMECYNLLNGLWLEIDHYQDLKMKCVDDTQTFLNFIESSKIFEFLAGLNAEFDPMRVQILGKERLPSLNEVFSIVRVRKVEEW